MGDGWKTSFDLTIDGGHTKFYDALGLEEGRTILFQLGMEGERTRKDEKLEEKEKREEEGSSMTMKIWRSRRRSSGRSRREVR